MSDRGPGESSDPRPPLLRPMGSGTLGRRLVLRVVGLVALAAVLLSSASTLATWQLLIRNTDDQLNLVTDRVRDDPASGLLARGQPIGTLSVALNRSGNVIFAGILGEQGNGPRVPAAAIDQLSKLSADQQKESVNLIGVGHYRVAAYPATIVSPSGRESGILIVGLPLTQVDRSLTLLIIVEIILSLLAIAGTVVIARALVERSLRPLNRVAATAQEVSQLQLERGEVTTAVRVPEADANPTSEVGRVGQAFNHMLNNVDRALEARQASEMKVRQFVADASHELRNPLAAIRGYAELARRGHDQLPEDTAYALTRVRSEAERMSALVEDLLLLARLDSGPDLAFEPVDLTELLINAANDARAAGPDHVWALALPQHPVLVLGDQHRLHQVVANLLANARTHTPPGTRVEAGLVVPDDASAIITITDDGPGIPPEIQEHVFERFTRADVSRVRQQPGGSTGLGLAIVSAVVEAHHGQVSVSSRVGQTVFAVQLPLAPQHHSDRSSPER